MRVYNGNVFCLEEHYARLLYGVLVLKIPVSLKLEEAHGIILKLLKENDLSNKDATIWITLTGIANNTHIPEEVLSDIASGINTNPTFDLSRKLFELHATIRRELYDHVMRKIVSEYSASA